MREEVADEGSGWETQQTSRVKAARRENIKEEENDDGQETRGEEREN